MTANRAWCVVCQFEGKKDFRFGTVFVPHNAKDNELEAAALAALDEIFPTRPKIVNYVPGQLIFVPEGA